MFNWETYYFLYYILYTANMKCSIWQEHTFIAIFVHERDVHTLFSSIAVLSPEAMCILYGDAYFTALKNILRNFDDCRIDNGPFSNTSDIL